MVQYTVKFFNLDGERYDFGQFYVNPDCEKLLDKLEEVLYIMEELTPVHRNWKRDLCTDGVALFTYHNAEHFTVSYDWNQSCIITVKDLRN